MSKNYHITCLIALLFITTSLSGCLSSDEKEDSLGSLVIAYEIQSDYDNIDENPQPVSYTHLRAHET